MRKETGVTAKISALVERREVADPPVETPGGMGPAGGFTPLHLHVTFPGKVSTAGIDTTFPGGVSTAGCRCTAPLGSEML